jgi:membrane associated rhomboid family serine protease
MFGVTTSDDYQPVTWVGRHPVHVTTLLVALHVFLMVAVCFLSALGAAGFLGAMIFDSAQVLSLGRVWQIATYAFVHLPYSAGALLWFAVEMYLLFAFGREVERHFGRRAFIILYLLLLLVPTLFLTVIGLWTRVGIAGSATLHLGIFLAFATLYPNVEMLLRIQMKWIAFIFIAIGTLAALANHNWADLIVLWATVVTAVSFVRLRGAGPELEWWSDFKSRLRPKPKFHIVQRETARRSSAEPENIHESIDPVLEKISKHGINSLTASERRALDRARNRLLKKPQ